MPSSLDGVHELAGIKAGGGTGDGATGTSSVDDGLMPQLEKLMKCGLPF
jgi:hypothetical protein